METAETVYSPNWKKTQPEYVREPRFGNYGMFVETRPVKVDCSLGVNPQGNLFGSETLELPVSELFMYPRGMEALKKHIRSRWPVVGDEEIVWDTGSEGVISRLARVMGKSAEIQGLLPQFLPGLAEFSSVGAAVSTMKLRPDRFEVSLEDLIARLSDRTTLLYLDNPHNPTGSVLSLGEIDTLAEACARHGILLLADEAYGDFLPEEESALNLKRDNIVCVRSFSKGCGMAGLRIGYAVIRDPELRRSYYSLGTAYPVSEASAAIASRFLPLLRLNAMRREVRKLKQQLLDFLGRYDAFSIAKTHPATPILLLTWKEGGNLYEKLMDGGIQTEAGHFFKLGDESVRLRTPRHDQFEEFCDCWRSLFGAP